MSPSLDFGGHFLRFLLLYNCVSFQGVVETLDRENDWLEMSEENARVKEKKLFWAFSKDLVRQLFSTFFDENLQLFCIFR